jgi:hypothetical protein
LKRLKNANGAEWRRTGDFVGVLNRLPGALENGGDRTGKF